MKTKNTKAAAVTTTTVTTEAVTGIAIRVVRAADKMGLMPRDVLVNPNQLALFGVDPTEVTPEVLAAATVIDRKDSREIAARVAAINETVDAVNAKRTGRKQPTKAAVTAETTDAAVPAKQPKAKAAVTAEPATPRVKIFGFAVTAVLRWMGSKNWSFEDAATAVTTLGAVTLSDVTIRLQLKAGRDGTRGPAAVITAAQAKKLKLASV